MYLITFKRNSGQTHVHNQRTADVSARIYHDYCHVPGAESRLFVKPIHMVKSALTFALVLRNNFLDF